MKTDVRKKKQNEVRFLLFMPFTFTKNAPRKYILDVIFLLQKSLGLSHATTKTIFVVV